MTGRTWLNQMWPVSWNPFVFFNLRFIHRQRNHLNTDVWFLTGSRSPDSNLSLRLWLTQQSVVWTFALRSDCCPVALLLIGSITTWIMTNLKWSKLLYIIIMKSSFQMFEISDQLKHQVGLMCLQMCQGRAVRLEPSSRVVPVRSGPSGRTSITPSQPGNSIHTPTPVRQKSSR